MRCDLQKWTFAGVVLVQSLQLTSFFNINGMLLVVAANTENYFTMKHDV